MGTPQKKTPPTGQQKEGSTAAPAAAPQLSPEQLVAIDTALAENEALKASLGEMTKTMASMNETIDVLSRGDTPDLPTPHILAMEKLAKADANEIARERVAAFTATIYLTNPYTSQVFYPNHVTKRVLVDSWVLSQMHAGILKEVNAE